MTVLTFCYIFMMHKSSYGGHDGNHNSWQGESSSTVHAYHPLILHESCICGYHFCGRAIYCLLPVRLIISRINEVRNLV